MYCIALPYGMERGSHDSFITADLLFKNGISEFRAEKAIEWLQTNG